MRLFPLLLVAFLVYGCASSGDVSQVRQDVTSVYTEQTSYMQKTDARIARLEKEIKGLEKTVGTPDEGLRKQVVDLSVAGESRDEKIKGILGKIDELESQLRAYWEEMKAELKDLKKGRGGVGPASGGATGAVEGMYKQGFDAFQKGDYADGVALFTQFVRQNPDSSLTPNAYYWMGECYMGMKDHQKAIVQFQEVVEKFPRSEKAARAMLRQAEAFAALGDKKSSTTLLKRVIELFPKTEEGMLADKMLRGGTL
jgi:tol-pal system protein YbgF